MISMMKWTKRDRIDIIGTILEVCMKDSRKTLIMYECNLNYEQVEDYLQLLLDRGLLEKKESPGSRRYVYKTTQSGYQCLVAYKQFTEIFNEPQGRYYTNDTLNAM